MKLTDEKIIEALKAGKAIYSQSCMFGVGYAKLSADGVGLVAVIGDKRFMMRLSIYHLLANDWEIKEEV